MAGGSVNGSTESKEAEGHYYRGFRFQQQSDLDAALASFTKAVELDPRGAGAHLSRGDVLLALRKAEAAEEAYREALLVSPDDPHALNHVGYFFLEQDKNLAEALQMIQKAVDARPANPYYLDSLGWAYFKLGHLDKAERHIAESLRLDASSSLGHEHLGDVYARQGRPVEARAAWTKALSLAPGAEAADRLKGKLSGKAKE